MPWVLFALGLGLAFLGIAVGRHLGSGEAEGMARAAFGVLSAAERRRLGQLLAHVRDRILILRERLNAMGYDFFVGQTMRLEAEQREKAAQGRSALVVPYWHGSGRAVDLYMYGPDEKLDMKVRHKEAYLAMHRAAEELGFRVLGFRELTARNGKTFTDPYHIELREGLAPSEALARYRRGEDRSFDGQTYA